MTFVFIDTNLLLHYPLPEQLDWCSLIATDSVTLIVAPVVVRELNEKKDTPGSRKTRDRAASSLRWLGQFIERPSAQIRENVFIVLQSSDPQIKFSDSRLSQAVDDDWLIAAVLEFMSGTPGQRVLLVTDDTGLRIKAQARGITNMALPHELRLPEEVDAAEKRVRELEEELRRSRSAMPDLRLVFNDGTDYLKVRLASPPEPSPQWILEKIAEIKQKFPQLTAPSGYSGADLARAVVLNPAEIDEYNKKLDDYYYAYEKYLGERHRFEMLKGNTVKLNMALSNQGGAPAVDIDIFMHFPDGFEVYDDKGVKKAMVEPPEPQRPRTRLEVMAEVLKSLQTGSAFSSLASSLAGSLGRPEKTMSSNVSRWTVEQKNSFEVRAHVKELKHGLQVELDPLFVVFFSSETIKSFTLDYDLLAGNVPDKVSGRLHVATV